MFVGTVRQAKRAIVAVFGFTLLCLGAVMLVTPGPGLAVIFVGLTVLAAEFEWARRLLRRARRAASGVVSQPLAPTKSTESKPQGMARAAADPMGAGARR